MDTTIATVKTPWKKLASDRILVPIFLEHFLVDGYISQRTVLLVFFSLTLGFNNTTLGVLTSVAVIATGLSQPLFGYLSDRIGNRILLFAALLWTVLLFLAATLVPGMGAAYLLILCSIGAGIFHPVGVAISNQFGRTRYPELQTTITSVFFLFGQTAFVVGPILAGWFLQSGKPANLAWMALAAIPLLITLARGLRSRELPLVEKQIPEAEAAAMPAIRWRGWGLAALLLGMITQATLQQSIFTFVPKHLGNLGLPSAVYGGASALFMIGCSAGNLLGGSLSDRYGKTRVAAISLILISIPVFIMSVTPYSWVWSLWMVLAGMCGGAAFPPLVVMGQQIIRGGAAFIGGLVLGFIFSFGALGLLAAGWLADWQGIPLVLAACSGLGLLGGVVTFFARPRPKGARI